jgi:hypothetical protein
MGNEEHGGVYMAKQTEAVNSPTPSEVMGFDVQVKAPSVISIMVSIEYHGDADEADVRLVVELYVHNLGIGGRFALRDLYALYEPLNLTTVEFYRPIET